MSESDLHSKRTIAVVPCVELPFDDVAESLREHALVRAVHADPKVVHGVLEQMLADSPPSRVRGAHATASSSTSVERCTQCGDADGFDDDTGDRCCRSCGVRVPHVSAVNAPPCSMANPCPLCGSTEGIDFNGGDGCCRSCGVCLQQLIEYGNPYRMLTDDFGASVDLRHWVMEETSTLPEWEEIERYAGHMGYGTAVVNEATRLMRRMVARKKIANVDAAVVAALVAASCPDLLHTRRATRPASPPGFLCTCGTKYNQLRLVRWCQRRCGTAS